MRYFIFIFFVIFLTNFALAEGINAPKHPESFDRIYQLFDEKFIGPMKQIMEDVEDKAEQEKEEIKDELKEKIKSELRKQIDSWLAPLKIKIQEGSGWMRTQMGKGIDWFKSLFK